MNNRQKKKRIKIGSTAKQRKRNKELCDRYPFLIPRNDWTDKICWVNKKFDNTLADDFPCGWWKAFGLQLCEELREDLIKCNYLNKFRFVQIKEKFGNLRCYTGTLPKESKAVRIINKYSFLSENICIMCGKPDVPMLNDGWYSPYCYDCYKKICKRQDIYYSEHREDYIPRTEEEIIKLYNSYICDEQHEMSNEYIIRHYSKDGDWDETIDISDTVKLIRNNWNKRNGAK